MKYKKRRYTKKCEFSQKKMGYVDYKDVDLMKRFVTAKGRMLPRKATGLCASYQRKLALAIKRARHMALLPFVS